MIVEAFLAGAMAATPAPDDDFWYDECPVRPGDADVTLDTAQTVTAVYACIQVRCETLAALPLHLMATDGRMRRRAIDHPLYKVLHEQPNSWQTSSEFREMMQGLCDSRGNAYAQIIPGSRGAVDQLIPLHPDRMEVFRLKNRRLGYLYRDEEGISYKLTQDEVFHLRLRSNNGIVGLSPIALGRRAVELSMRAEEHGIRYMKAGQSAGVIKMPQGFYFEDEDHAKRMGKSWREAHTGKDLYSVAFLEAGAEWEQIGLNNTDSQWLESRTFQLSEIARMFRVPVYLIGGAIAGSPTMYANVEQSDMHLIKHTMLSIAGRWEGAIGRDLIVQPQGPLERFYAKFALEGLLRADSKTRALFYEKMLKNRVYTRNEVRELEDMNPIEGGDDFEAVTPPALPPPGNQDGDEPTGDDGASSGGLIQAETDAVRCWIADAAERIAGHEITQLETRADKAAVDREKFDAWVKQHWGGKVQEYCARTLSPIFAVHNSPYDSAALVASVVTSAVAQLTTGDPVEVVKEWKTGRAKQITELLKGDLDDDK